MNLDLYNITYDHEQWDIQGSRDTSYHIRNLKNNHIFQINGDIIGISQVTYDEFLVYRRIMLDTWQIVRFQFTESGHRNIVFKKEFRHFYILSEKTILFDTECVYDVETNCEVETFNWLKYKDFEVVQLDNYKNTVLLLSLRVDFDHHEYIYVCVDAITFEIIRNEAFSTLRGSDKTIKLSNTFTLDDLLAEDKKYLGIIQKLFFSTIEEVTDSKSKFLKHIDSNS